MQFPVECIECLVKRHAAMAKKADTPERGLAYMREVLRIIADAPEGVAVPYLTPLLADAAKRQLGAAGMDYAAVKAESNRVMEQLLPGLRERVFADSDPLRAAMSIAVTCNYIDFTALYGRVDFGELETLLDSALENPLQNGALERFREELRAASSLLILCDNAGEIYADRLLGEALKKEYPRLRLTYAVRGKPAVNDALREDALQAGLDKLGDVIDNGTGISGTELGCIGAELKEALYSADVILAKGQGNLETLFGCGLNIYYAFLCKCGRFCDRFGVPPLTGMFVSEKG